MLLRGINVGGSNLLSMKALKTLLESQDCRDVQTYIQSGNVVLRSAQSDAAKLEKQLTAAVGRSHGFEPRVLALTCGELEKAARSNPFRQAEKQPKSLHLLFLAAAPAKPDVEALAAARARTERFELKGRVFYLHTPDGFGKSKLAARAERLLGVAATARNWSTVTTLLEMGRSLRA